jgi:hypothetical protein
MSDGDVSAVPANNAGDLLPPTESRRQRIVRRMFSIAWALNLLLFAGACGWIAADGQFMEPVESKIQSTSVSPTQTGVFDVTVLTATSYSPMSSRRMGASQALGLGAICTLLLMFAGLFLGARQHRRLRTWLALTAILAAWLGLCVGWPELAWAGKQWRARRAISQFDPVAASLRKHWPIADDATPELGPFSAYPNGAPTIVMPLLAPSGRGNHAPFSAVERSSKGALRFELLGNDAGAWLEWHPAGSTPASFVGGLETEYQLLRQSELGNGWHLTRYRAAGLSKSL